MKSLNTSASESPRLGSKPCLAPSPNLFTRFPLVVVVVVSGDATAGWCPDDNDVDNENVDNENGNDDGMRSWQPLVGKLVGPSSMTTPTIAVVAGRTGVRATRGVRHVPLVRCVSSNSRIIELGRMNDINAPNSPYFPGQFFFHRRLGYRGVVLYPWQADLLVYPPRATPTPNLSDNVRARLRDVETASTTTGTFYQVLCDQSDASAYRRCGFGTQTWAHANAGVVINTDYVDHDDMVPYTPPATAQGALGHGLYSTLFQETQDGIDLQLEPRKALQEWMQHTDNALRHTKVFRCTTNNVQVTVIPVFEGFKRMRGANALDKPYSWYYKVSIQNLSDQPVQLLSRRWTVVNHSGEREYLSGRGILQQFPLLAPEDTCFQFLSCISLSSPQGVMGGHFTFVPVSETNERGVPFQCEVPTFQLHSPFMRINQNETEAPAVELS